MKNYTERSGSPEYLYLRVSRTGVLSLFILWIGYSYLIFTWNFSLWATSTRTPSTYDDGDKELSQLDNYCSHLPPINSTEFHARQKALAKVLHSLNASAYIAEPGASAHFYGNISSSHWGLSERPLLLIISPDTVDGEIVPKISVLAPSFEATRAKMLPIPHDVVNFYEWPEDTNPYETAALAFSGKEGDIFVDGAVRYFIVEGLQKALPNANVGNAPGAVKQLRERKSPAEIELLKCANEATLLSIREVHKRMYIGMHESEARQMMSTALAKAGLSDGGCLTLFGENAALPHGSGTDRVLTKLDFALFDCTANLHGYNSDVTRTVALPDSDIPGDHLRIWRFVHSAQTSASYAASAGAETQEVDAAARRTLEIVGYAPYFTHRLGHGIGLEVHEDPYLRGGTEDIIQTGHTFSNEPGVYIEGQVGVRLEDCFYINDEGISVFLTAGVGGQAASPLHP